MPSSAFALPPGRLRAGIHLTCTSTRIPEAPSTGPPS